MTQQKRTFNGSTVLKKFRTGAYIIDGKGGWKLLLVPNSQGGYWWIKRSRNLSECVKFHNSHINKNNWTAKR